MSLVAQLAGVAIGVGVAVAALAALCRHGSALTMGALSVTTFANAGLSGYPLVNGGDVFVVGVQAVLTAASTALALALNLRR